MDKDFEELDADFKTFSSLNINQGQIRLHPGVKRNIKAFVQWTRDQFCLGMTPWTQPFPVQDSADLMRRYKTHENFKKKSKTVSEAAKPEKFTSTIKWNDWIPTFLNYLCNIPGRDGVPLKYICRKLDEPHPTPNTDFLDDYVSMAPLAGEAFAIDSAEVHTFLVNLIAGNPTAETKLQTLSHLNNGHLDFLALRDHYEGIGILALDVTKAELTMKTLFYSGEKKPHMWWEEFEKELTQVFTIYEKHEGRAVYSNQMKLCTLMDKVDAIF